MLLQALLVSLDHLLERVTRTNSESGEVFVHDFTGIELDLQMQGVGIIGGGEDFINVFLNIQ